MVCYSYNQQNNIRRAFRTRSVLFLCKEDGTMPYRPQKPCLHPGCAKLVGSNTMYCDEHKPLHREYTRSASSRGYGSRWQKVSKAFIQDHPLCAECLKQGRYTEATVVDHITPHRGDQRLFWSESNWQPLCKPCHDKKTGREDSKPTYTYRRGS